MADGDIVNRIAMQELYVTNGESFRPFWQYCYDGIVKICPEANEFNRQNPWLNPNIEYNHYRVFSNGKTCYIPTDYAMVYNECMPEIIPEKWMEKRHFPMDTTTDYIRDVNEWMNIDMKRNYRPQHNGDFFKEYNNIPQERIEGEK